MDRAVEYGLDLVEVSPNSRPPVCRILDYGKYKYEQSKKEKAAKKRQHSFQMKEMRYRPKIDEHDYQFKLNHVREFLMSGAKVRTYVMFRGREMAYTERGRELLDRVAEDMAEIAIIDVPPKQEGRHMAMILSPKPEVVKQLKDKSGDKQGQKEKKKAEDTDSSESEEVVSTVDDDQ